MRFRDPDKIVTKKREYKFVHTSSGAGQWRWVTVKIKSDEQIADTEGV